jgi:hypothetical protein
MKRYLVFAGAKYYACGGWWDKAGQFDTVEEAINWIEKDRVDMLTDNDWHQIVDTENMRFVEPYSDGGHC